MKQTLLFTAMLAISTALARPASADTFYYVDWQSANVAAGTASGVINVPGETPINVNFAATFADGSPGNLHFAQTNGGTNYWNPQTPYISASVSNAPPDSDILALVGGQNQIYTVTLSRAIQDPIMALVSVGQAGTPITYNFDSPFDIVSQGVGYWGGGTDRLEKVSDTVLGGAEGHGTIRFDGSFSTFTWLVPNPESWHGFTFGVRGIATGEQPPPVVPLPPAAWAGTLTLLGLGAAKVARRRFA